MATKLEGLLTGTAGDGAALTGPQARLVIGEQKAIKEAQVQDGESLTLGVRARLAGGIVSTIGEVPAGAKELPAVLQAPHECEF